MPVFSGDLGTGVPGRVAGVTVSGVTGRPQAGSGRQLQDKAEILTVRFRARAAPLSGPESIAPQVLAGDNRRGPDFAPALAASEFRPHFHSETQHQAVSRKARISST